MPEKICPYFGKNEDLCDVGCGYISTHDVNMIIKFAAAVSVPVSSIRNCVTDPGAVWLSVSSATKGEADAL